MTDNLSNSEIVAHLVSLVDDIKCSPHNGLLYQDVEVLPSELIAIEKAIEALSASEGEDKQMQELYALQKIREAVGDDGKLMQYELIEVIKNNAKDAARLSWLRCGGWEVMQDPIMWPANLRFNAAIDAAIKESGA